MKSRTAFAALGMLCIASTTRAESIEDVLARMDAAAKQFHSYSTNVDEIRYGALLRSKDEASGVIRMMRAKSGAAGIMDMTADSDHIVYHIGGNAFEKYLPKANTVERYDLKKYAALLAKMVLLGFAVNRDEIKREYDVKLAGSESVNGVATSHIALTPKSTEALKIVKVFDLWIDPNGHALRQKETEPDDNYRMETFSGLKVNPALPDSAFELKTPPGTKVVNVN